MLPCEANGDPPPKTRWRRIGPGFPPDGKWSKKVDLSSLNFSYLVAYNSCIFDSSLVVQPEWKEDLSPFRKYHT